MAELQPLLARNRYSTEEWANALAGKCGWCIEYGNARGVYLCDGPSSPGSFYRYCADHDREAREDLMYYGQ